MGFEIVATMNYERVLRAVERERFYWMIEEAKLIEGGKVEPLD